jgi:pimeloyl-ACP methyl ester carboxylesterase
MTLRPGWNPTTLGGVPQRLSLRGRFEDGPILLWLSGGPGASEFGSRRGYLRALEDHWLVVDWEQPGSGLSYRGELGVNDLSFARLVADTLELVGLLQAEFHRRKLRRH